jgi:hypothetical protein
MAKDPKENNYIEEIFFKVSMKTLTFSSNGGECRNPILERV